MAEVFAPALTTLEVAATDPDAYLREVIKFANESLDGKLCANIVIYPKTITQIGKKRFEETITELHFNTIAINTWNGLGFLTPTCQ